MKRIFLTTVICFLGLGQMICNAERENFEERTVLYKGESVVSLGISYYNLGANNSDIYFIASGVNAKGSYLKASPFYSYAYMNNQAAGVRLDYSKIQGGADNISIDLLGLLQADNVKLDVNTQNIGATVFNRSYFGLDRKGNVGLYCEVALSYKNSFSKMGSGADAFTRGNDVRLSFSPGFILYFAPFASLSAQLGLAHVGYGYSKCYKDGAQTGSMGKWNGGVRLSLADLMFGINFHF